MGFTPRSWVVVTGGGGVFFGSASVPLGLTLELPTGQPMGRPPFTLAGGLFKALWRRPVRSISGPNTFPKLFLHCLF